MKNAIILHGQPDWREYVNPLRPKPTKAHWLPWLRDALLEQGVDAVTPKLPRPYAPDWDAWRSVVDGLDITPDTMLVGHSRGGEFWLRWLTENPKREVGRVALVAPALGYFMSENGPSGHFGLDPSLVQRTGGVTLFASSNDGPNMIHSAEVIRTTIPGVDYREFQLGHFTLDSMGGSGFPELLRELVRPPNTRVTS